MSDTFNISFVKYNPQLGRKLGKGASMFIAALQFGMNNKNFGVNKKGHKWVYNTSEQWAEYLGYSSRQIERIIAKLKDQGIILVQKLNHCKANRINYYTVDETKLATFLQKTQEAKDSINALNTCSLDSNLASKTADSINKMSESCRHNGGIYTKNTNLEINKSEEKINSSAPPSEIIVPNTFSAEMNQVQQVKIKKIDLKKEKAAADIASEPHSSPKTTVAQDMLAIWNHTFEKNLASMSKQLAPLLVAAYKHKFGADMQKWKQYCLTVASSPYLTGEKFNLSLLWALKYTTIDRVNNREFGVKEMITSTYSKADAMIHIENVKEPEICKELREKLLTAYGEKVYKDWFEELHFELIGNDICFKAKNNFINDYVKNKFGDLFTKRAD